MRKIKLPTDRTVFSTDNNGYAGKERDETLVDQNLWDSEIAADDRIPDGIGEIGEDDRPVYDEEGYTHAPGDLRPPRKQTPETVPAPRRRPHRHTGRRPFRNIPHGRGQSRPSRQRPVLHIPCAFFQSAIKYFTARHVSMSEFGNEGICP